MIDYEKIAALELKGMATEQDRELLEDSPKEWLTALRNLKSQLEVQILTRKTESLRFRNKPHGAAIFQAFMDFRTECVHEINVIIKRMQAVKQMITKAHEAAKLEENTTEESGLSIDEEILSELRHIREILQDWRATQ